MQIDYTLSQNAEISNNGMSLEKDHLHAIDVSERAQKKYREVYGPRPVTVHILASTVIEGAWYISPARLARIEKYGSNKTVFAFVTTNEVQLIGWMFNRDIRNKMYRAAHGCYDIESEYFEPITTFKVN